MQLRGFRAETMVNLKRMGARFEYRVAHLFERFGYFWDRSGSSLGIDLKILKEGRLRFLVNCKKTSKLEPIYLKKFEVEQLEAKAFQFGAQGLICFGFRRTPIFVVTLDELPRLESTCISYKLKPSDGRPLAEFLSEIDRAERKR
jgi:Holliday junction resolvase